MKNPYKIYMENPNKIIKDCIDNEETISLDDLSADFKGLFKSFRIIKTSLLVRTICYRDEEKELDKVVNLFLSLTLDANGHPFLNKNELFIVKEIDFKESIIKILINANKLRFALSERAYKDLKIEERKSMPPAFFLINV